MSSKPSRQLGSILSTMPPATATSRGGVEDAATVLQLEEPPEPARAAPTRSEPPTKMATGTEQAEAEVPLQVTVPKHIRKQLLMMATEQDRSVRALILMAVRSLGIEVAEQELRDKRRKL